MVGTVLSMVRGILSGAGAAEANSNNKSTKDELGAQYSNLRSLADPVGAELEAGYAPGGWLRAAAVAKARSPVERRLGSSLQTSRGDAWRYGGSGSGLAKRRWQDAQVGGASGFADATAAGDTEAMDVLARMDSLRRGYKSAFAPETIYSNRYAWVGDALGAAGDAYGGAQQTTGQAERY